MWQCIDNTSGWALLGGLIILVTVGATWYGQMIRYSKRLKAFNARNDQLFEERKRDLRDLTAYREYVAATMKQEHEIITATFLKALAGVQAELQALRRQKDHED